MGYQRIANDLKKFLNTVDTLADSLFHEEEDKEKNEQMLRRVCYDLGSLYTELHHCKKFAEECVLAEESKFNKKEKNTCDCNDYV